MTFTTRIESSRDGNSYRPAVLASKRARFEIDRDVLRGRTLDTTHKYLPDALSFADRLAFLNEAERRLLSQIQGRTYANIFGLVERFIGAKVLELTAPYRLADQDALEALVRFSDEEIKHQEMFRRVEAMCAQAMPPGYTFEAEPNAVARAVLSKSSWAVLALICHIEMFVLAHYKSSIATDPSLSPLWKDVFLFHWKEEAQHAVLDELEWRQEDLRVSAAQRDQAVDDFIALVSAVDGILQQQASADARYFIAQGKGALSDAQRRELHDTVLAAYRYQYVFSGLETTQFPAVLFELISAEQRKRVEAALANLQ